MIRLIGTRWKYSNVWSQGVLIGRISCKECCTSTVQFYSECCLKCRVVACKKLANGDSLPQSNHSLASSASTPGLMDMRCRCRVLDPFCRLQQMRICILNIVKWVAKSNRCPCGKKPNSGPTQEKAIIMSGEEKAMSYTRPKPTLLLIGVGVHIPPRTTSRYSSSSWLQIENLMLVL